MFLLYRRYEHIHIIFETTLEIVFWKGGRGQILGGHCTPIAQIKQDIDVKLLNISESHDFPVASSHVVNKTHCRRVTNHEPNMYVTLCFCKCFKAKKFSKCLKNIRENFIWFMCNFLNNALVKHFGYFKLNYFSFRTRKVCLCVSM